MPKLPFTLGDGVPLDCGELPVSSVDDVTAEWARELQDPPTAPVRDAIQQGQLAALLEYQRRARYAAAQSDPLRATDEYLEEIGGYERGIYPQPGESNDSYRARVTAQQTTVDPNDIIAAANAILAPYTSISCRYAETSDGLFLSDGTSTWSSHIFDAASWPKGVAASGAHANANYPDRLYPDATPAGLTSIPNRRPPGAMLVGDSLPAFQPNMTSPVPEVGGGHWFLLRCPDIGLIDTELAALYDAPTVSPLVPSDGSGFFLTDGSGTNGGVYPFDFASSADDIYNAVIGAVNAIVGQGIRWTLIVDPALTA